ncbi:hypothetical protein EXIGLDRAFT_839210 [Exidia glandulosa HHB12029]|uniref:Uncharacterized protein n=1 Tax=Exidia glandulosa HHB12029 TaxID=1314781 RepID=A0A165F5M1_EXIGL|nr:hypothetical protein EXIGLDRAFT_839210 [Exidia glandulosa HHB12029]
MMKLQTLLPLLAVFLAVSAADLDAAQEAADSACMWGQEWNATLVAIKDKRFPDATFTFDDPDFLAVAEGTEEYRNQVIACGSAQEKLDTEALDLARSTSTDSAPSQDVIDAAQAALDSKCRWGAEWNATLAAIIQKYYPDNQLPLDDPNSASVLEAKDEFKDQVQACDSAQALFNEVTSSGSSTAEAPASTADAPATDAPASSPTKPSPSAKDTATTKPSLPAPEGPKQTTDDSAQGVVVGHFMLAAALLAVWSLL